MKKILTILLLLPAIAFSQHIQTIGTTTNKVVARNVLAADSGFIAGSRYVFTDTTQANRGGLDTIAGMQIRIGNAVWQRTNDLTRWFPAASFQPDASFRLQNDSLKAAWWVNVKDFGAKGDNVTNDQAAIQAAQNSLNAIGGGVLYFPNGRYKITGGLITNVGGQNPNSQLYINSNSFDANRKVFTWLGESIPNFTPVGFAGIAGVSGVQLITTITGSGARPSVIGCVPNSGSFSGNGIVIQNIQIIIPSNTGGTGATMCGINAGSAASVIAENVVVTIDSSMNSSVDPTANETFGILTTEIGGETSSYLKNCIFIGLKYGVIVGEHLVMDQVQSWACDYAFLFPHVNHASYASRLGSYWCKYTVATSLDTTVFYISELNMEVNTTGGFWYQYVNAVYDPNNYGRADINYQIVQQNVGSNPGLFSMNGGSGIRARLIGSAAGSAGSAPGSYSNIILNRDATLAAAANDSCNFNTTNGLFLKNKIFITRGANGTASTDGILLDNTSSGTNQTSPRIRWSGLENFSGQVIDWIAENQSNGSNGDLAFSSRTNGGAFTSIVKFRFNGASGSPGLIFNSPSGQNANMIYQNNGTNMWYQRNIGSDNHYSIMTGDADGNNEVFAIDQTTHKFTLSGALNFSGALMPGNDAGILGKHLVSNGIGSPPSWKDTALAVAVVASGDVVEVTSTQDIVSYTTPNTPNTLGVYQISADVRVSAVTGGVITVTVSYTDEGSVSRTATFYGMGLTSAGLTATGVSQFPVLGEIVPLHNTVITVTATLTVGTATYTAHATIMKARNYIQS
jgi:hypothetical protein